MATPKQPSPSPKPTPTTGRTAARPWQAVNRSNWWLYLVTALVAIYLLLALIFGIGVYRGGWSGPTTRNVSRVVPFLAARVGMSPITYSSFLSDVESIKHYYATAQKVDFKSKDGKTRLSFIKGQVLTQQIENKVISQEAAKRKVKVNSKEIAAEYKKIVDANGGEGKVKDILTKYYGWSTGEFKTRIKEQLLRQKVQNAVQNDPTIDSQAKKRAEDVKKQLKSDGSNFAELAKKYSEDTSASQGGDLGTADASTYVAEFSKAALSLPLNTISDPIKTQFGYHIMEVLSRDANQVHVRHILIKTKDFQAWLTDQEKSKRIHRYIKTPSDTGTPAPAA